MILSIKYFISYCLKREHLKKLNRISKKYLEKFDKIGEGTFGEIYKGHLNIKNKKQHVAIKKSKPKNVYSNDLLVEALLLSNCDHENLIKIFGVCFSKNKIDSIIMEYMNSGSLLTNLLESNVSTLKEAIHITSDIAKGCEYLESIKMVHRYKIIL
jgi:serine/threonine protein kinase